MKSYYGETIIIDEFSIEMPDGTIIIVTPTSPINWPTGQTQLVHTTTGINFPEQSLQTIKFALIYHEKAGGFEKQTNGQMFVKAAP